MDWGGVTDPGPQGSMDLLGEAEEWGDSVVPMRGSAAGDRQPFHRGLGEPGVWLTGRRAGRELLRLSSQIRTPPSVSQD